MCTSLRSYNILHKGATDPTYLKEPADKFVTLIAFGGFTCGFGLVLNGLYNMANGINKI